MKIIQIQAMPNDPHWQGVVLGLGDDGITYMSEHMDVGSRWVPYVDNRFVETDTAEVKALKEQIGELQSTIKVLEAARPHWAQGYTSESVAAQSLQVALSELWELLGAEDQTEAVGSLKYLIDQFKEM